MFAAVWTITFQLSDLFYSNGIWTGLLYTHTKQYESMLWGPIMHTCQSLQTWEHTILCTISVLTFKIKQTDILILFFFCLCYCTLAQLVPSTTTFNGCRTLRTKPLAFWSLSQTNTTVVKPFNGALQKPRRKHMYFIVVWTKLQLILWNH